MKIESIFENKKAEKKPVLSFEIFPPKKEEALKNIDEILGKLCELNPAFISVTFGAGGSSVDNKTVEIAKKIKNNYKIEPLVHLTCLHYGKSEICDILEQLNKFQIENVLALRGDVNPDLPLKQDFKYANELVSFIKSNGDFGVSGACYPEKHLEAPNMETDIINLKRKVDSGVSHLVSQLFFNNDLFYSFYEKIQSVGIDVPVDAGIMPVTNKAQIERMVNMCGATLTPELMNLLNKYENNTEDLFKASMEYTINQITDLIENGIDGIHIYTMNNPRVAKTIYEGVKGYF